MGIALGVPWLETLLQDMRYGVRILRRGYDSDNPSSSWPEYEAFRSAKHSLSGIAASDRRAVLLRHGDTARLLLANVVSPNYFDVLRVRPMWGRVFREGEFEVPDAPHVIMFSYDGGGGRADYFLGKYIGRGQ